MNREIIFKGKRTKDKKWVQGNLIISKDVEKDYKTIIIPDIESYMHERHNLDKESYMHEKYYHDLEFGIWHSVDPDTICQYTGVEDRNGIMLFENDLIEVKNKYYHFIAQVVWDDKETGFCFLFRKNEWVFIDSLKEDGGLRNFEVVGNIFDNKELIME